MLRYDFIFSIRNNRSFPMKDIVRLADLTVDIETFTNFIKKGEDDIGL